MRRTVIGVRRRSTAVLATGALLGSLALAPPTSGAGDTALQTGETHGACAPSEHLGGEWNSYGGDLANTRNQEAEDTIGLRNVSTLTPAWSFGADDGDGGGDFTGTPVVVDGCVFVGSNSGFAFAINADSGEHVWTSQVPDGGGINSSAYVEDGVVYFGVSRTSSPYVIALDQQTGELLWQFQTDDQPGSDIFGSPVVFDGILAVGVSGGAAELGPEDDRYAFQGAFVLLETQDDPVRGRVPGTLLRKTYTIHSPETEDGFAGATVWATFSVDPETRMAYVGSGNPFQPQEEHENANAVLKIDLDRASETFGEIVDSYKGIVEEYNPILQAVPCVDIPGNPAPYYPQGVGECGDLDLDFGASANLFTGASGRKLVGVGQKAGVYHVFDAETMEPVWQTIVGPPSPIGGIVGSTAIDDGAVYGPIVPAGYLFSLDREAGTPRWFSPVGDAAHWGNPVSLANDVVYTVDLRGFLDAYEASTGLPLAHLPMKLGSDTGNDPLLSWGGVAIARNTVYAAVGMTGLPNGYVIAYRPTQELPVPDVGDPGELPPVPSPGGTVTPRILSGAQAQFYGYLTPAMVVERDGSLVYTNTDIVKHDVVQDVKTDGAGGPDDAPWCGAYPPGGCPVFRTPLLGLGESAPVEGLDRVEPGAIYTFYCTLHPGMKGRLAVAP